MTGTTLIHLRPTDPVDQLCDIYVGPAICAPDGKISRIRSQWYTARCGVNDRILRRCIRDRLGAQLYSLRGKTLGCTCTSPDTCPGQLLVQLCNRQPSKIEIGTCTRHGAVFFMGRSCPLSNLYSIENFFVDGKKFENAYNLYRWFQQIQPKRFLDYNSRTDNVCSMYKTLLHKWDQCEAFRELARRNSERLVLEATRNRFWGCGLDYWNICYTPVSLDQGSTSTGLNKIMGKNILGWLIKIVCSIKDQQFSWKFSCQDLSDALITGLRLCIKTLAEARLLDAHAIQKFRKLSQVLKKKKKKKLQI